MGRTSGELGTGMLGSLTGLLVFLALLLFATHLLVGLHATTVVTDAAADGAAVVAHAPIDHRDPSSVARACTAGEHRARELVGRAGAAGRFECVVAGGEVVLRVRVPRPQFLLPGLGAGLGDPEIDRTARARVEELR